VAASGRAWRRFAAGLLATGAEGRSQIGWVIVGGITFGTSSPCSWCRPPTAPGPHPPPGRARPRRPPTKPCRSARPPSHHRRRQGSPNRCGRGSLRRIRAAPPFKLFASLPAATGPCASCPTAGVDQGWPWYAKAPALIPYRRAGHAHRLRDLCRIRLEISERISSSCTRAFRILLCRRLFPDFGCPPPEPGPVGACRPRRWCLPPAPTLPHRNR
jgi:hypothetical protein